MLLGVAWHASSVVEARPELRLCIEAPFIQYKDRLLSGMWVRRIQPLCKICLYSLSVYRTLQASFFKRDHLSLSPHQKWWSVSKGFTIFIRRDSSHQIKKVFTLSSHRTTITPICLLGTCWGKSELETGQSMDSSLTATSRMAKLSLWRSQSSYSTRYATITRCEQVCLCIARGKSWSVCQILLVRNFATRPFLFQVNRSLYLNLNSDHLKKWFEFYSTPLTNHANI